MTTHGPFGSFCRNGTHQGDKAISAPRGDSNTHDQTVQCFIGATFLTTGLPYLMVVKFALCRVLLTIK